MFNTSIRQVSNTSECRPGFAVASTGPREFDLNVSIRQTSTAAPKPRRPIRPGLVARRNTKFSFLIG